jgi:hypothetical protein
VTFARGDLLALLEETLPGRFGGTGLDYQLVEEEAADGFIRFTVRASPSVGPIDEAVLCALVLEEIGRNDVVTRHHAALIERAGTVRVVREPPLATRAGKILPLLLASRSVTTS